MVEFSIPQYFPISKLVAQELTQICIGSHDVRLNFYEIKQGTPNPTEWQPGAIIDIESGFELREGGVAVQTASNENLGYMAGCLTVLLRQCIRSVERLPNNELVLVFSSGAELKLLTDPIGFESYHLHINEASVDVTYSKWAS